MRPIDADALRARVRHECDLCIIKNADFEFAGESCADSVYKLNRSDAPAAAPTPPDDPYEELTDDDGKLPF